MKPLFLLDVDETLVDTQYRLTVDLEEIVTALQNAQTNGAVIGLSSDSALSTLRRRASSLMLNGPIIAERGAILITDLSATPEVTVVESKLFLEFRKAFIKKLLSYEDILTVIGDVSVISNKLPILESHENNSHMAVLVNNSRECSLAFFARERTLLGWEKTEQTLKFAMDIAESVGNDFTELWANRDVDRNPKYGICILHHKDTRKQNALRFIPGLFDRHTVFMIGDSMSDWLEDSRVIHCAVANASDGYKQQCQYVASNNRAAGVIELIKKLTTS